MPQNYTLITGASKGIGAAFARVAAERRRNLILTARSEDALTELAAELRAAHTVEVVTLPADLAEPGAAQGLWAAATEGRQVNFLMNNAGLASHGAFTEADWAREQRSIDINVTALTELCKLAAPHMVAQGRGRILNVASTAAFLSGPGMAVYFATKAYVLNLSVALNEELREKGVTVTALCPGATRTSFFDDAGMNDVRMVKQGPMQSAEQVAQFGYNAAVEGREVAIPGAMNASSAVLARFMPRGLLARVAGVAMAND
ncbi:MAG: SDR family oxidoreductase [Pseudomonadota bacterium]